MLIRLLILIEISVSGILFTTPHLNIVPAYSQQGGYRHAIMQVPAISDEFLAERVPVQVSKELYNTFALKLLHPRYLINKNLLFIELVNIAAFRYNSYLQIPQMRQRVLADDRLKKQVVAAAQLTAFVIYYGFGMTMLLALSTLYGMVC